jgi:hypothetical protein
VAEESLAYEEVKKTKTKNEDEDHVASATLQIALLYIFTANMGDIHVRPSSSSEDLCLRPHLDQSERLLDL